MSKVDSVRVDRRFLIEHLRCFGSLSCSESVKCPVTYDCWKELLKRMRKA